MPSSSYEQPFIPTPSREVNLGLMQSPGLVSIVVLCCGQIEHSRLCAPSIFRFSRAPYEVIVVDAGSLDGTYDYWRGAQAAATSPIEIIRSPADVDLAATLQAGLARTHGESIVLLNNDTIVSTGWLEQLVALLSMNSTVGMVAPMTTYGPTQQVIWPVSYRVGAKVGVPLGQEEILNQLTTVDRFAQECREKHRGQWFEADRLGGGCVMLKKKVLQGVGPPPRVPLQFFDAEALSLRVREKGYVLAGCRDLFVHSFGSRGFSPPPAARPG
jgi:O-antigen biosynthesis protein